MSLFDMHLYLAIFCGPLNNPSNGRVSQVTPPVVGSTATYSCNVGFRLVGANRRVCQADSSYTGVAPTCEGTHKTFSCITLSLLNYRYILCTLE